MTISNASSQGQQPQRYKFTRPYPIETSIIQEDLPFRNLKITLRETGDSKHPLMARFDLAGKSRTDLTVDPDKPWILTGPVEYLPAAILQGLLHEQTLVVEAGQG